jgi:hypothetical protein
MKLSLLFYPNLEKFGTKTGKVPIYVRIALNRKKAEMRLNIDLLPEELKKWDERTMRFTDRDMSAYALLNTIDKKFEDFRHHHSASISEYNVKTIRNLIPGLDLKPTPLISTYVEKYYTSAIAANIQITEGTKVNCPWLV